MFEELRKYIQEWEKIENIKPKNETQFIKGFIDFLENMEDDRDIEFQGDGAYFGKQISIGFNRVNAGTDKYLNFEVAYNSKHISIYTGKNDGYWTPEYVNIDSKHNFFIPLQKQLKNTLMSAFGLE